MAAALVAVIELTAVRKAAVAELSNAVVLVAQGAPALVFGDQAVLQIVFIRQRPVAVVDVDQTAKGVIAVMDLLAIGQGFDQ